MSCRLCAVTDPLHRTPGWSIIPALDRAPQTLHHLWLVPDVHVPDLLDLSPTAQVTFWPALHWVRDTYNLAAYGLAVTAAEHVYAQVVVGDLDDPEFDKTTVTIAGRVS